MKLSTAIAALPSLTSLVEITGSTQWARSEWSPSGRHHHRKQIRVGKKLAAKASRLLTVTLTRGSTQFVCKVSLEEIRDPEFKLDVDAIRGPGFSVRPSGYGSIELDQSILAELDVVRRQLRVCRRALRLAIAALPMTRLVKTASKTSTTTATAKVAS
jgi:hypothetical protein